MKQLVCCALFLLCTTGLSAEIREIHEMKEILPVITKNTLVLFDMDDTVTDSTIMLGTGVWRKSLRDNHSQHVEMLKHVGLLDRKDEMHDKMTHFVATQVPVKPVEADLPQIVEKIQAQKIPVYIFTARGKSKWYSTDISGIDSLTDKQLAQAGFNFGASVLPPEWENLDPVIYANGVLYTSPLKKEAFLKNLLESSGYRPEMIVFIDGKKDQLESVEKVAEELGIPYIGFWYTRANRKHQNFNEDVTMIQFAYLEGSGVLLNDQDAAKIVIDMRKK